MADRRAPAAPRYNALVASAAVMRQRPQGLAKTIRNAQWQDEAWDHYDTNGELRFGIGWVANGLSRVNLVAAHQPKQQGDEPTAIVEPQEDDAEAVALNADEELAVQLVQAIAGGVGGQAQLLAQLATLLSVPGVGWVLIEAAELPDVIPDEPLLDDDGEEITPTPDETWVWRVLSNEEIRTQEGVYQLLTGSSDWRDLNPDHVLIKVWRAHPRKSWEADSPCRAVLGTLRQIRLLDEHVVATATSRLAGAGLLLLPSEVEFKPIRVASQPDATPPVEGQLVEDDFTDTLIDTMTTPIGDRGSAASVVPLIARIPGEYVDKVRHITFWSEFSETLLPLREGAIKRLALGLDMPPEVLTGVAGVNHWTAWQVEETAVTLHLEPLAEVIVSALSTGYLRPAMMAAGRSAEVAADFMVFYDTTDLTTRPDRSEDATAAYDRYELSGVALRREGGLSESDAPDDEEVARRLIIAAAAADASGLVAALELLGYTGTKPTVPAAADEPAPAGDEGRGPPDQETGGEPIAAAVMIEACDGLVHRALERAGTKLRSAAGRKMNGGASAIVCDDVTKLHTQISATSFARIDDLVEGAWGRVPSVAERLDLDPEALAATLDAYVRALLVTGHEHDSDRLADALGLAITV